MHLKHKILIKKVNKKHQKKWGAQKSKDVAQKKDKTIGSRCARAYFLLSH